MDVRTTVDPAEAIRWASEFDVDVIVCDQRMPKMQGIEALREIRMAHPRAMRILLTGYADLSAVLGSVNEGEVFRYINKPWDNNDLRQTVQLAAKIARDTPVVLDKGIDRFQSRSGTPRSWHPGDRGRSGNPAAHARNPAAAFQVRFPSNCRSRPAGAGAAPRPAW